MRDLAEFLRARWDEEETVARRHTVYGPSNPRVWNGAGQYPVMTGRSLLADLESKRAILSRAEATFDEEDGEGAGFAIWGAVELLTLPYADHPDFDPLWRHW